MSAGPDGCPEAARFLLPGKSLLTVEAADCEAADCEAADCEAALQGIRLHDGTWAAITVAEPSCGCAEPGTRNPDEGEDEGEGRSMKCRSLLFAGRVC